MENLATNKKSLFKKQEPETLNQKYFEKISNAFSDISNNKKLLKLYEYELQELYS